jgi:hypothetical protein
MVIAPSTSTSMAVDADFLKVGHFAVPIIPTRSPCSASRIPCPPSRITGRSAVYQYPSFQTLPNSRRRTMCCACPERFCASDSILRSCRAGLPHPTPRTGSAWATLGRVLICQHVRHSGHFNLIGLKHGRAAMRNRASHRRVERELDHLGWKRRPHGRWRQWAASGHDTQHHGGQDFPPGGSRERNPSTCRHPALHCPAAPRLPPRSFRACTCFGGGRPKVWPVSPPIRGQASRRGQHAGGGGAAPGKRMQPAGHRVLLSRLPTRLPRAISASPTRQ